MAVPWRAALRGACCSPTRGAPAVLAPELRLLQPLRELDFFFFLAGGHRLQLELKSNFFGKGGKNTQCFSCLACR